MDINLEFVALILMIIFAASIPIGMLLLAFFLGPKRVSEVKLEPFECGRRPVDSARKRFSIKFYLIAILFLVFELEVIGIYLWAVLFRNLGVVGFYEMLIFIAILFFGFLYAWREGGLEWQ